RTAMTTTRISRCCRVRSRIDVPVLHGSGTSAVAKVKPEHDQPGANNPSREHDDDKPVDPGILQSPHEVGQKPPQHREYR
ncbi:MAG TPA: hypothetical protein VFL96_01180, partial [Acidobacteriaceae bacterium]|nr:hypothetical protein [Acidobacteriaceae bacterium]